MESTQPVNAAADTLPILDRLVEFLGFHDVTSFIVALIFVVLALAFVVSGAIFLSRKRRERIEALHKIVNEVQAPLLPKDDTTSEPVKITPKVEEKIAQLRAQPIVEKAKLKDEKPAVAEEKILHKKVSEPALKIPKPVLDAKVKVREVEKKTEPAETPVLKAPKTEIKIEPRREEKKPEIKPEPISAVLEPVIQPQVEQPKEHIVAPAPEKRALGAALKNTRGGFMQRLARLFSSAHEISDEDFEAMEAILFTADIGVKTAQKLLDSVRQRVKEAKSTDPSFLRTALKDEMRKIFASAHPISALPIDAPRVLMFVGVNGAGKTTSIGKLGAQLKNQGKAVYFGAGDTFRAAAVKQLSVWGERVGAPVISGKENSDSASVLFEAIDQAKKAHADVVLCDTAGRLHTKSDLMEELKKVHRVVNKAHNGAPHEVFLVVDATMGQNAIMQAREFADATPLTGVVLSKLDGTAKGGVALGIVDQLKVPIRYVGIGEQVDDLKEFDADQFIDALFEENNE